MAKKDATLFAQKSSDHSMVRIRMVGHLDMMPESPTRSAGLCLLYSKGQPQASRSPIPRWDGEQTRDVVFRELKPGVGVPLRRHDR